MRRFLFALISVSLAIAPSASLAAPPVSPGPAMMMAGQTVVRTCLQSYVLHAAFNATQLHSLGQTGATPANQNDVTLKLDGSFKYSDHIGCFYKSAHNDIFNLVYNFPCVNPAPAGQPNSYRCKA
jgi:hypothetical protein